MRKVIAWPDKRLRTKAAEVEAISDETRALWDQMIEVMDAMPGVGLAAVQLGEMVRLAVVDASAGRNKRVRLANPVVIEASAKMNVYEEASPNLPNMPVKITRPRAVKVRYLDETGAVVERDFVGLEATSVQHQIDHLDGKMYFDRLSKVKRDMFVRRARKVMG